MKKILLGLPLLAVLALGSGARADVGVPDPMPAATLLLPYFEVDLSDPAGNGVDTFVTIQNSSATAVLVHVIFWTDLGFPTLRENIYLTGFDMETLDLRSYFVRGRQVRTASAGQDPQDRISPHGPFSQDINFASCSGQLPASRLLNDFELQAFQQLHTGQEVTAYGMCTAQNFQDHVARGYITFDTVNNCTLRYSGDPGYFSPGGSGDATNQNVLVGEFSIVNRTGSFAARSRLVAVEASATNPQTSVSGQYTFYGRYTQPPFSAADNREPLSTTWAVRYDTGGSADTDVVVWRDPTTPQQGTFACDPNSAPPWYPLDARQFVAFDDQENPSLVAVTDMAFPAQANRARVGGAALPVPFSSGWLFLNLNTVVNVSANPPEDPSLKQAHVLALQEGPGGANTARGAVSLHNPAEDTPAPVLPISRR
jgi:hypothetical protein